MKELTYTLAVLAMLITSAGCDSTVSDADDGPTGSDRIEFTYSGAFEGSFLAQGIDAGLAKLGDDGQQVVGMDRRGTGEDYLHIFQSRQLEVGTYPVAGGCEPDELCSSGWLMFEYDPQAGAQEHAFMLESGGITVASVTSTRISGTFAFVGRTADDRSITISEGTFDVTIPLEMR